LKKLLPATYDLVYKMTFGSEPNKDVLRAFLRVHLEFEEGDELDDIELLNPFVLQEFRGDKFGILDVKVRTKRGRKIDVEIQVEFLPSLDKRELYYRSKLVTEQIGSGDDYELIQPVITILILAENYFGDGVYHHCFRNYDTVHNIPFSTPDLTQTHVLELAKLGSLEEGSDEWAWGTLISTDDEEVLNMLAARDSNFEKAVSTIKQCSTDPALRARAESLEFARMDEAVRRRHAIRDAIMPLQAELVAERAKLAAALARIKELEAKQ